MTPTQPCPPLTHAAQARFLAGPVAINVASRSPALVPSVARAYGCRVCDGGHELVVFLATTRSRAVLRDLGEGAPIAVIFSRPKTHVSLQLKGERADVLPLTAADREIMRAYGIAFAAEICALGYPMEFAKRLMQPVDEPAVGVRFATTAVFEQTPGPRAGERLGATGS